MQFQYTFFAGVLISSFEWDHGCYVIENLIKQICTYLNTGLPFCDAISV